MLIELLQGVTDEMQKVNTIGNRHYWRGLVSFGQNLR